MSNRVLLSLAIMISYGYSLQPVSAQIQIDGSTATQVNGNTISPTGSGTVSNGNLFHSFNQFNVTQTGVIFNTGNSNVNGANINNIINRVTGDTPSSILGTIQSRQSFPNANVYLINPNGIVFGQNAKLDIGGSFHANTGTGLTFSNNQTLSVDKNSTVFPSGDPQKILFTINQPAGIINQGNLQVDAGKSITFTGGTIVQTGSLTAPNGNVAITSVLGNRQVELRSPDAVLGLTVESSGLSPDWNGKITDLPNLAALLTSKVPTANQVVIKPDGSLVLVEAVTSPDILVSNGTSVVSGKIDVSSPLFQGGNVGIFGNQVSLVNAKIDASGLTGGGTVLVGGNLQGNGIQPNAVRTFVDSSSMINVSAILNGNGGKAIIWADQLSRFFGNIFSNGGSVSGDGGFVEVSGKEYLIYRGNVDTSAANGKSGTLLLDPTNITIQTTGSDDTELSDDQILS
ncbi:MAG: filamentous hemagglutinin N-terminal domain-containing protein, partial [Pseudanabaena sp.]